MSSETAASPSALHEALLAALRRRVPACRTSAAALARSTAALDLAAVPVERHGELGLAHGAALGDAAAVTAFERAYLGAATGIVRRYAREPHRTDEIVQLLRIHLLVGAEAGEPPRLARYDGKAPLAGWVGMCASRLALHALRTERNQREVATEWSEALAVMPSDDPMIEALRAQHAEQVTAALAAALQELPRRHRAIVRLLFSEGASVDEVATMYGVHRVTVWRWLQEARALLGDAVRAGLQGVAAQEDVGASVLVGWALAQVELSLDGALSPTQTDLRSPSA
jgi:RNA polymerase sigma-70 factor (ECF subfamily)